MDTMTASIVAFACAAVACAVSSRALFVNGKSKAMRLRERARAAGCVARGEALETNYTGEAPHADRDRTNVAAQSHLHVTYRYVVDGREYRCGVVYRDRAVAVPNFDKYIDVYYDPADPSKAVPGNIDLESKQHKLGCYLTILITIFVFAVVGNVLIRV